MKKVKVVDVANVANIVGKMILAGATIEDVKAIVRFRREVKPTVDLWNDLVKETIEKIKPTDGATISEEDFNVQLNAALHDEAIREVEVTPFALSEVSEEVILQQSKVSFGELEYMRNVLNG
jgi:hypothetical protein